jgi:hypothetical protein
MSRSRAALVSRARVEIVVGSASTPIRIDGRHDF